MDTPDAVQIPLKDLEIGRWYVGRGRNGNVGLWNGEDFLVIGKRGIKVSAVPPVWENQWRIKIEPYFTETEGCFQPFAVIDEGVIVESLGGSDSRYAKSLRFANKT